MAVYTEVSETHARALMHTLGLGELQCLTACAGGIENTNYFVTTRHNGHDTDYVLTLFERLDAAQLPFYLGLMNHLAQHAQPVPQPQPDADGQLLLQVCGKPAVVVNRLAGAPALAPGVAHCQQMGAALARLHLAARDFALPQPNPRGLAWWNTSAAQVLPYLTPEQAELVQTELAFQNALASTAAYASLPRGAIHADLFRDNALFDTSNGAPVLSGVFDFYFAGVDVWVLDLAVCLNDWCIDPLALTHQAELARVFISAYQSVRPLLAPEQLLLPAMLRAGALRFWLSRLLDLHQPRPASVLTAHNPGHFEQILRLRAASPDGFPELAGLA